MTELFRAAYVIARRDFTALIFSKSFILFLLGPVFPLIVGLIAGTISSDAASEGMRPRVAVLLPPAEAQAFERTHSKLVRQVGPMAMPDISIERPGPAPKAVLARRDDSVVAVLSGSLAAPLLTGKQGDVDSLRGPLTLATSMARVGDRLPLIRLDTAIVAESQGSKAQVQLLTGRAAQVLMFLVTMLLAGMVLSNMVEEKTNKIIEVLAAAVPVDAIFIGKLLAMLAMSMVGICVWGGAGLIGLFAINGGYIALPPPAVGWIGFVGLGILYYAMAYVLLGSLFIGIGAQAATVREVQTLSMPVTMMQVLVFFFATFAVSRPDSGFELAAALFPFSSPFTMIVRAAQSDLVWPHFAAVAWQLLWVAIIIRVGVGLFRRNVLKSGPAGGKRKGAAAA